MVMPKVYAAEFRRWAFSRARVSSQMHPSTSAFHRLRTRIDVAGTGRISPNRIGRIPVRLSSAMTAAPTER
jgi:hypothetical protein